MTIAALIGKSTSLKGLAPVLVESLRSEHRLILLCGPNPFNAFPKNPAQNPVQENIYFPGIAKTEIVYFENFAELETKISALEIKNILTLDIRDPKTHAFLKHCQSSAGVKIHYLQFYGDFLYANPEELKLVDNFFVYSQEMWEIYKKTHGLKNSDNFEPKIKIVGNPNLDPLRASSKKTIRQKYRLPANQFIVLFMSTTVNLDQWRQKIFGSNNRFKSFLKALSAFNFSYCRQALFQTNYRDLITAIKKWCFSKNAFLIIKTKIKHHDPDFVKTAADVFFEDKNNWHPPLALELIQASDLVISLSFSSTLEALAMGVPAIQILDPSQTDNPVTTKLNERIITLAKTQAFFPNFKDFPRFMKRYSPPTASSGVTQQIKITTRLFGPEDYLASKRIIDIISKNK